MEYRQIDPNWKIVYYGIEGSFSHEMALKLFGRDALLRPAPDLRKLESGLVEERYDIGIVPAINSGAGPVRQTLDTLLNYRGRLHITDSFGLLVDQRVGGFCDSDEVEYIISHPVALQQCANKLSQIFPNRILRTEDDTALAVKKLAEDHNSEGISYTKNTAVVGSKVAFEMYGVPMYEPHSNIADHGDENITSFLWIERRNIIPRSLTKDEALILGIDVGK